MKIKPGTIVKGKHLFDDTCTMYGEFVAPDKILSSTDGLAIKCTHIEPVNQSPHKEMWAELESYIGEDDSKSVIFIRREMHRLEQKHMGEG